MRKDLLLLTLILFTTVFSSRTLAVEAGGEVEVILSGGLQKGGSFETDVTDSINLEFFLPRFGATEVCYAFQISNPLQDLSSGEKASYFAKKLYLKRKFEGFHLTIGRQPVSWSFGSLLNPVDYTLGAVALDEESNSKYTDALEVYLPINWNSGISIVTSFPAGFDPDPDKMKWGVRSRMGVRGYDLTLNYVQEPEAPEGDFSDLITEDNGMVPVNLSTLFPRQRGGLSFKGDLGGLGVYGAYGYYFGEDIAGNNSYLLGADYSYNLNHNTKITMQVEYLGVELNFLEPSWRTELLKMGSDDRRLDLLTGNMTYPIDDFTSLSLMSMVNLDDGSLFLTPGYQTTLPSNLDLKISGTVFLGKDNTLFAPGELMPQAIISVSMSYPF